MSAKSHPEKVSEALARAALARAKSAGASYSEYIRAHYQATGSLAPGCDAKDLIEWYKVNMPEEFGKKGGK